MWRIGVSLGLVQAIFLFTWPRIIVLNPYILPVSNDVLAIITIAVAIVSVRGLLEDMYIEHLAAPLRLAVFGGLAFVVSLDISFLVTPSFPPGLLRSAGGGEEPKPWDPEWDVQFETSQKFFDSLGPTGFWQFISSLGVLGGGIGLASHVFWSLMNNKPITQIHHGDNISIGRVKVSGDTYNLHGQNTGVGRNAKVSGNIFQQMWENSKSEFDMNKLIAELKELRVAMKQEASDLQHDIAIAEVAKAETAGTMGDGAAMLRHLNAAGSWSRQIAERIGVTVAAKAIQNAIGIPG
ncbi:hypothetical protein GC163_03490 [bacterium]|nr:hypothetical protein [bacterium]